MLHPSIKVNPAGTTAGYGKGNKFKLQISNIGEDKK